MAERRMFAKKIINSARFLKMPSETQNLYFHLGINADDDGVVEAYSTMRLVGSSEDNLKLLSAKGFIRVLNDDLVSHIVDWTENNKIRADRKVDSLYKDLLLEIIPDVELIEPKTRSDRPTSNGTSQGQPMDGIVEDSIVEDRVGKFSLVEVSKISKEFDIKIELLKDFISYRKDIKKTLHTIAPLKSYAKSLNNIREKGMLVEDAINTMKDSQWNTIKYDWLLNTGKLKAQNTQKAYDDFIDDGEIIETELF